ncbi:MAG TPA: AsnC family transcriptional regulator, partial [Bacteroidetes bacterium]|nr:AsnC family transcriptional regulator [Bacteroidota bacterium]
MKALAAEAGLSLPAVSERLKRLEEAGVVTGYRAEVDVAAL